MTATKMPSANASWRDSARSSRLGPLNSSSLFPLILFFFHIQIWTFILALLFVIFLSVLSRYGFSITNFGRLIRSKLAGRRRIATPWWF